MIDKNEIERIREKIKDEERAIPNSTPYEVRFLLKQIEAYQNKLYEVCEKHTYSFNLRHCINGFVLRVEGLAGDEVEEYVYQNSDDSSDNFVDMVYELMSHFIDNGNKYSEKRLYLIEAPGYDNESWSKMCCPLCGREPEKEKGDSI